MIEYSLFEENLKRFGSEHGDNSLRYIGLRWSHDMPLGKVYRSPAEKNKNALPENVKKIWDTYFEDMSYRFPIKICDYSYSTFNKIDSIRLEVIIPTTHFENIREYILSMERLPVTWSKKMYSDSICFANSFVASDFPLRIIGVETDYNSVLLNLKYYLYFDKRSIMTSFSDLQLNTLNNIFQTPGSNGMSCLKTNMQIMEQCYYTPLFVGVNHNMNFREVKLYYISRYKGRKIPVNAGYQIEKCISFLNLQKYFSSDFLYQIRKSPFFLEGVAYSLTDQDAYRLYFKEIPKRLF